MKIKVNKERLFYLRDEALRLSVELRRLMVGYNNWRQEMGDFLMLLVNAYRWLVQMSNGNSNDQEADDGLDG